MRVLICWAVTCAVAGLFYGVWENYPLMVNRAVEGPGFYSARLYWASEEGRRLQAQIVRSIARHTVGGLCVGGIIGALVWRAREG